MAKIIIDNERMVATVDDFLGFDADWNEILVPVDREAVKALEAQGYTIDYTSDDI